MADTEQNKSTSGRASDGARMAILSNRF